MWLFCVKTIAIFHRFCQIIQIFVNFDSATQIVLRKKVIESETETEECLWLWSMDYGHFREGHLLAAKFFRSINLREQNLPSAHLSGSGCELVLGCFSPDTSHASLTWVSRKLNAPPWWEWSSTGGSSNFKIKNASQDTLGSKCRIH